MANNNLLKAIKFWDLKVTSYKTVFNFIIVGFFSFDAVNLLALQPDGFPTHVENPPFNGGYFLSFFATPENCQKKYLRKVLLKTLSVDVKSLRIPSILINALKILKKPNHLTSLNTK